MLSSLLYVGGCTSTGWWNAGTGEQKALCRTFSGGVDSWSSGKGPSAWRPNLCFPTLFIGMSLETSGTLLTSKCRTSTASSKLLFRSGHHLMGSSPDQERWVQKEETVPQTGDLCTGSGWGVHSRPALQTGVLTRMTGQIVLLLVQTRLHFQLSLRPPAGAPSREPGAGTGLRLSSPGRQQRRELSPRCRCMFRQRSFGKRRAIPGCQFRPRNAENQCSRVQHGAVRSRRVTLPVTRHGGRADCVSSSRLRLWAGRTANGVRKNPEMYLLPGACLTNPLNRCAEGSTCRLLLLQGKRRQKTS